MKYLFVLLLIITPVTGEFLVVEDDVYTYNIVINVKEYENKAPVKETVTNTEKAVRIDKVQAENVSITINYAGKNTKALIQNDTLGAEVTGLPSSVWAEVENNPNLLALPEEYDVGQLTMHSETFGSDFQLTLSSENTVEGNVAYTFYFSIVYNTENGVRTAFSSSIREEVGGEVSKITTSAETLISTTDPFPESESKISLMMVPILLGLISFPLLRRKK